MFPKAFLVVLPFLWFALISSNVVAQPAFGYVLSPRVEDEIDSAERDYFGLFPSIAGFLSARGSEVVPGGVSFSIRRTPGMGLSDTAVYIGGDTLAALKDYLEQYEFLFGYDYQPAMIHLIMSHVRPGYIQGDVHPVAVETREGRRITGRMLFCSDSMVVLWRNGSGPYHWRRLDDPDTLAILHVSQIEWMRQDSPSWIGIAGSLAGGAAAGLGFSQMDQTRTAEHYLAGIAVGALGLGLTTADADDIHIGGNPEALSLQRPRVGRHAMFPDQRPPELARLIARMGSEGPRSALPPVPTGDLELEALPVGRVHLYTGLYWGTGVAKNQSMVVDLSAYQNPGISGTASLGATSWELGLAYSISQRIRVGGMYALASEPSQGEDRINEYVQGEYMGLTGSFVIMTSNPLRSNPLELTTSGGVLLYNASYLAIRNPQDTLYDGEKSVIGLMLNARLGYYATRRYSLWVGFEGRLFPPFSVPEADRVRILNDFIVEHEINPSSLGLTLGTQLYF